MSDHVDDPSPRIPNAASTELAVDGRLIYVLEQRRESDLSELEAAALVESLRSMADGLEGACLDRPASDVLDEANVSVDVDDDTPSNVSD
jgi:hypothetical protein